MFKPKKIKRYIKSERIYAFVKYGNNYGYDGEKIIINPGEIYEIVGKYIDENSEKIALLKNNIIILSDQSCVYFINGNSQIERFERMISDNDIELIKRVFNFSSRIDGKLDKIKINNTIQEVEKLRNSKGITITKLSEMLYTPEIVIESVFKNQIVPQNYLINKMLELLKK